MWIPSPFSPAPKRDTIFMSTRQNELDTHRDLLKRLNKLCFLYVCLTLDKLPNTLILLLTYSAAQRDTLRLPRKFWTGDSKKMALPWLGGSVGWVPSGTPKGCGFDLRSGSQRDNLLMFLFHIVTSMFLSLSSRPQPLLHLPLPSVLSSLSKISKDILWCRFKKRKKENGIKKGNITDHCFLERNGLAECASTRQALVSAFYNLVF